MEDDGFVDDDLIEETAWEYVANHGRAAASVLRQIAETAEKAGDGFAAPTWRAVAEIAERIVGTELGPRETSRTW